MTCNESCWVLTGDWDADLWWAIPWNKTTGSPFSVEFDYNWVLERENKEKDIIGWLHTHPGMVAMPSSRDHATFKAWVSCLGKPLVCVIKGIDGWRAWWYLNDEDEPVEYQVKAVKNLIFGVTPEEFFNEEEKRSNERIRSEDSSEPEFEPKCEG